MTRFLMTTAMTLTLAGAASAQTTDDTLMATTPLPEAQAEAPMADAPMTETTAMDAPMGEVAGASLQVPGFLASQFAGKSLYALDPELIDADGDTIDADDRWTNGEALIGARAEWDDIGTINDTILSQDGRVRGVLVDIGGFLGIGAKTVMVDMNTISFVPNDETVEDLSDFYAVAGVTRDQLEALPDWSEESLVAGYPWSDTAMQTGSAMETDVMDAEAARQSSMATGGPVGAGVASAPMEPTDEVMATQAADDAGAMPTAEELTGTTIVDGAGDSVGEVSDVVLDQAQVSALIVDVGGFLGMGTHTVAIPFDGVAIVRNVDTGNVDHVQTSLTREELEALPAHD